MTINIQQRKKKRKQKIIIQVPDVLFLFVCFHPHLHNNVCADILMVHDIVKCHLLTSYQIIIIKRENEEKSDRYAAVVKYPQLELAIIGYLKEQKVQPPTVNH